MGARPGTLLFYSLSFLLGYGLCINQVEVDYMAKHLDIEYKVINNIDQAGMTFSVSLTNSGSMDVATEGWSLYFSNIRILEPDYLLVDGGNYIKREGTVLGEHNLILYHVNGVLFKIEPTKEFNGLKKNTKIELSLTATNWQVARTDTMPNWYIAANNTQPRIVTTTAGQSLDFVGDFTEEAQYKRSKLDQYKPYIPSDRYDMYPDVKEPADPVRIVPKVIKSNFQTDKMSVSTGDWVVRYTTDDTKTSAEYLAKKLNIRALNKGQTDAPRIRAIDMVIDPDTGDTEECKGNKETYTIDIKAPTEEVTIRGREESGLFWGVQTLLALTNHDSGSLRTGTVEDCPRFGYRGMHVDVARNFYPKETILKLLDIMSTYKLNQFHFHLTDDEGWRLEIPGLPELTEVGGRRCHDLTGDQCIMPQLGSPPSGGMPGSGFYTQEDYKEILRYAKERHIKVIPEFDMPGHAHAAINAMLARERASGDASYLLNDPDDSSRYLSVQAFIDDAINPCVNTTYAFVEKVVDGVMAMHNGIQDLDIFNFGGDEVPKTAWVNSTACNNLVTYDIDKLDIKKYFVERVSEIAKKKGLGLAGWEDGVMYDGLHNLPFNLSDLSVDTVYAYAWNNIWEWGSGSRAYRLANAGYKTVLSHGTNLYFDHPHEPDPEERGYYWATRFTNTKKTFGFMPDTVYENMDFDLNGNKITKEGICKNDDSICPPLQKTENIVGIQGQLWSETVRTSRQFEAMVYPRLLAVAERAWHKAAWESETDPTKREAERLKDWEEWANLMGHKELQRLDDLDIHYHILPPGAKLEGPVLKLRTEFPGLRARASLDNGATWCEHTQVEVTPGSTVLLQTNSADRSRQSRMSKLEVPRTNTNTSPGPAQLSPTFLLISVLVLLGAINRL